MLYTDEAIKKRQRKTRNLKKISSITVYIIVVPLLIYNIFLIIQALVNPSVTPSFLGIKTYVIISGSMEPDLNIGDIVIAKDTNKEELKVGDIICFRQGQSVITHRISEIIETSDDIEYKTKGDNNNSQDSGTITEKLIEGKVINKIPYLGNLSLILQQKVFIIFIVVIFYIYLIQTNAIKNKKNERKRKRLKYERDLMNN